MRVRVEFTASGMAEIAVLADDPEDQTAGIRLYERLRPGLLELDQLLRETFVSEATPRRSRGSGGGGGGVGEAG